MRMDRGESVGSVQDEAVIAMETAHYNSIKREEKKLSSLCYLGLSSCSVHTLA